MKTLLIATALLVPALAHANNSDCIDMASALAHGKEIVTYCRDCGDKAPGVPAIAAGAVTDPVHTYVRTAPDRFENLALLTDCASSIEPPTLTQEVATADGVLITPSDHPVLARPADVEPAEPPPPPAPSITYTTTIVNSVPWLAIAGAAGGLGLVTGACLTLLILGWRRRRVMKPRAVDLPS